MSVIHTNSGAIDFVTMSDTNPCPLCQLSCKLDSCDEVDIGVGTLRGNELWDCPLHGRWAIGSNEEWRPAACLVFHFLDGEFKVFRPFKMSRAEREALTP